MYTPILGTADHVTLLRLFLPLSPQPPQLHCLCAFPTLFGVSSICQQHSKMAGKPQLVSLLAVTLSAASSIINSFSGAVGRGKKMEAHSIFPLTSHTHSLSVKAEAWMADGKGFQRPAMFILAIHWPPTQLSMAKYTFLEARTTTVTLSTISQLCPTLESSQAFNQLAKFPLHGLDIRRGLTRINFIVSAARLLLITGGKLSATRH